MEELQWTEEEEESAEHPYYNNIPGKMPPPGGIIDTRLINQNASPEVCQVRLSYRKTLIVQDFTCKITAVYVSECDQIGPGSVDQTYYQGRHLGENWGDDRKAMFIQQGKETIMLYFRITIQS